MNKEYFDLSLYDDSLFIIREVFSNCKNPCLLFSGGKDSITLLDLTYKAFYPQKIPFPILHIDTGRNFPEVISFRDRMASKYNVDLIIGNVQDSIKAGKVKNLDNINAAQSTTLLEIINDYKFDALLGGARRDEDRSRAKERIFSHRDKSGKWNPMNQRPELWNIFNSKLNSDENFRIFPLSDWTEIDIWKYIKFQDIEVPDIYFSHKREVFLYNDMLVPISQWVSNTSSIFIENVRFRTVGDLTCTAAIRSNAVTVEQVIDEILLSKISERGATRLDDKINNFSMEERKMNGYF